MVALQHNRGDEKFQFLIGTINPGGSECEVFKGLKFQFLIGTINPMPAGRDMDRLMQFQFLIGTINPAKPKQIYLYKMKSFNSS